MRVLVFGNSGSGKSTWARQLASCHSLSVLDLDEVVWSRTEFATFRGDAEIIRELEMFMAANLTWVIEGCYGRWMEHLLPHATELVFLNPSEEACLRHCRERPWEPGKYATKAEQDAKLPFLLDWVRAYATRTDDMSLAAHRRIFDAYPGPKRELTTESISCNEPEAKFCGWPRLFVATPVVYPYHHSAICSQAAKILKPRKHRDTERSSGESSFSLCLSVSVVHFSSFFQLAALGNPCPSVV